MGTREANAFKRLKERITRPEDRFERIENGIGDGNPDVNYCMVGTEGWIEIKCPIIPVLPGTPLLAGNSNHRLGVEQANWFLRQSNAGGRAYLFVATETWVWMIHGVHVAREGIALNKWPLAKHLEMALWKSAVPVRQPTLWQDLREQLTYRNYG